MQEVDARAQHDWWAQGDTPVRTGSRVTYLVDGRDAMLMMCRHFLLAQHYIYLANWGITPQMELVRGTDRVAGAPGSPEQAALLAELRAEGLQEQDIAFWCAEPLTLQRVLGYAVSKGVEVKMLLWKCSPLFSHYQPSEAQKALSEVGVACVLDDSAIGIIHHPVESLHQKISVVDGTHAFVGGVDLFIEHEGEFDRWDTHAHAFSTPLRRTHEGITPHPWHDAHSLIEGPAVSDVELNFRQRWNDVARRHRLAADLFVGEHPQAPPLQTRMLVQVARTIPQHTYGFDEKNGIQGIAQLYAHAFSNIQRFAYLENQYFWLRVFTGIDLPFAAGDSSDMKTNILRLGDALQQGAQASLILPDHPNVGRAFTDAGLQLLRDRAPEAVEEGRLHVFCLGTSERQNGRTHYRPIYVHAKVGIIDDLWSTVGSGNLNNRGMRDDTEMNVATYDPTLAHGLRLVLQGEHLGIVHEEDLHAVSRLLGRQRQTAAEQLRAQKALNYLEEMVGDPAVAMKLMHERAWENLRRYQANQELIGHLLPYLTADEAMQQGLNFREEHGWIEEPAQ